MWRRLICFLFDHHYIADGSYFNHGVVCTRCRHHEIIV
jgi:hypothetical protein